MLIYIYINVWNDDHLYINNLLWFYIKKLNILRRNNIYSMKLYINHVVTKNVAESENVETTRS